MFRNRRNCTGVFADSECGILCCNSEVFGKAFEIAGIIDASNGVS